MPKRRNGFLMAARWISSNASPALPDDLNPSNHPDREAYLSALERCDRRLTAALRDVAQRASTWADETKRKDSAHGGRLAIRQRALLDAIRHAYKTSETGVLNRDVEAARNALDE